MFIETLFTGTRRRLAAFVAVLITLPGLARADFTATYDFTAVSTASGTTDPTAVPVVANLTLGSFTATGTPVNPNAGGRFSFTNWPTGGVANNDTYTAHTGAINPGAYYAVTLTPQAGYALNLTALTFTVQRSGTGIRTYAVRSNAGGDGFATNLPGSISPANANLSVRGGNIFYWAFDANSGALNGSTVALTGAASQNVTTPVTFRFYGWNAEAGTGTFSIDNVVFTGNVVPVGGTPAPTITTPPASQAVTAGTNVSFNVVAGGTGPFTYQWRKGGSDLGNTANISGALTDTLSLTGVLAGDAGSYDVVVTNAGGSTPSPAATLTVNPAPLAPSITTPPSSQTVAAGGSVTFSVTATGTAPLAYQWRKNTAPIAGATSASFTINPVATGDAASYDVVVSNGVPPDATSAAATLTVTPPPPVASSVSWNFGTSAALAAPSTVSADVSGGEVTAGNGNGSATLLSTTSASSGYAGVSGQFNAGVPARIGALNTGENGSAYFEFTVTPADDRQLTVTSIGFGSRSTATAPKSYTIFSSLDGYAAALASGPLAAVNTTNWGYNTVALSGVTSQTGLDVTFRIYGADGAGSPASGTINWRIDDLKVSGTTVTGVPVPPAVTGVTPASGATGVVPSAPVTVTFNRSVNVSAASFTLVGSSSGAHAVTVTGGPRTYTLTPTTPLELGETVTFTVVAAQVATAGGLHPAANHTSSFTTLSATPVAINAVQGAGLASPYASQAVLVRGIVTASFQGPGGIGGYYLESLPADRDSDDATSEGLLVFDNANPVVVGDEVTVSGTVVEYGAAPNSETELSPVYTFAKHSSGNLVSAAVALNLPFPAAGHAERYEGMRVTFPQALTVTDNFSLGQYGEVTLSNGRLPQPTNIVGPGAPAQAQLAANLLNQVILDDGLSPGFPSPTPYLNSADPSVATRRAGDTAANVTGIFGNKFGAYVVEPTAPVTFVDSNPRSTVAPAQGPGLRVAIGNVLNFFNGDGAGGGFPTSRGATSFAEYQRQRAKIIAGIAALAPDIMGLTEVENDGYGPASAIADLVNGLNAVAPAGTTYAFVDASAVDVVTDVIHCAFIYRVQTVGLVGNPAMLNHSSFVGIARNPLAQTFRQLSNGEKLTVAINHFKSKGTASTGPGATNGISPNPNLDQGDGQGASNYVRVLQANALTAWLATDPTGSGDPDFLIIGDLNAYAKEDPIVAIENAGYLNLTEASEGVGGYSYAFDGAFGHLDHALANPSLASQVVEAATWHVNSDEPVYYDYNLEDKDAAKQAINAGTAFRYSDHDPVVVRLNLQPPSVAPVITMPPAAQTVDSGTSVTFSVVATGFPAPSYQWRKDGNPIASATSASLTFTATMADAGSYDVIVSNGILPNATSAAATLTVNPLSAIVVLDGLMQTYTGAPRIVTTTTIPAGLPVAVSYPGGPAAPINAGNYAVTATVADPNYTGFAAGTLEVSPAAATIALGDLTVVYNGSARAATVTTTPAGVATTVTYNGAAALPVAAGSYPVFASLADANYAGAPASDTLTILPAAAGVALSHLSQTYDGAPHPVTVTTSPAGLPVQVTYAGSPAAPINAGSYAVTAVVTDPNYAGAASGTLVVNPASATITLGNLAQVYDGSPKPVTITTAPADLTTSVTYNGSATVPSLPGSYAVVATITAPGYSGTASGTLFIDVTAVVRSLGSLNGKILGSVQVNNSENITLNGGAQISGRLLVAGTPAVRLNGNPAFGGTTDSTGAASPANATITLNGGSKLGGLVRRVNASAIPVVAAPPAPTGTRNVSVNAAGQAVGDFATIRNLTLNGNGSQLAVPAGTYGSFTANGSNTFVFGVAGATTPAVYNLQGLTLNGSSKLVIAGPVILNLASGTALNGSIGEAGLPELFELNIASGGLTLNGSITFDGYVTAPAGTVTVNGGTILRGRIIADKLVVNGSGVLEDPDAN
jgi:predicted extracellular nuclease